MQRQRQLQHHTLEATVALMEQTGARFRTLIDVGSADGYFGVLVRSLGLLKGVTLVNIDPQATFEPSLKLIRDTLGGHYRICALGREDGTLSLNVALHPYWSSMREQGDDYWKRIQDVNAGSVTVPMHTLDGIVRELALEPPFLIKLDVQGAEADVLDGGVQALAGAEGVIVEADIDEFAAIHRRLDAAGLRLFDLAEFNRVSDNTLGWFYGVYVDARIAARRSKAIWPSQDTERVIRGQEERRRDTRRFIAEVLPQLAAAAASGGTGGTR